MRVMVTGDVSGRGAIPAELLPVVASRRMAKGGDMILSRLLQFLLMHSGT